MSKKNEVELSADDVWNEHLDGVSQPLHWAYLFAVLIGGFLLMIALIAFLGGSSGG